MFLLCFAFTDWAGAATGDSGWEQIGDEDGIQVFKKEISGSPILAFKGIGIVASPISKVASVLIDDKRTKEWVDAVEETRIIRLISKYEAIVYSHVKTPIIMRDRDFVTRVKLDLDRQAKTVTLSYSPAEDPDAPKTKGVRGVMMDSSFKLVSVEGDTKTLVTAEIHADPKGMVPKWVVNLFQKVWPRKTLENMRMQAAKVDIADNDDVKEVLFGMAK